MSNREANYWQAVDGCERCGALVEDAEKHAQWHDELAALPTGIGQAVNLLIEEALERAR